MLMSDMHSRMCGSRQHSVQGYEHEYVFPACLRVLPPRGDFETHGCVVGDGMQTWCCTGPKSKSSFDNQTSDCLLKQCVAHDISLFDLYIADRRLI